MSSGSSIGGVIFPIMTQRLIPEVGFGWAMRIGAFLILFLLFIANLTIRSRLPPCPRPLSRSALTQPLREMKMLLVTAGFTLLTFGMYVPIDYLVVEGISNGLGTNLAQYLPAIMNAGRYVPQLKMYSLTYHSSNSFFGRLSSGIFADLIGTYNVFAIVCCLAGILVLALWIPTTSTAGTIVFAVLFGYIPLVHMSR